MTTPSIALAQAQEVDIASGSALSGTINLAGRIPVGIAMPAAWTAADLTFQMSPDQGTTWFDMFNLTPGELAVSGPTAGNYYALDYTLFLGVTYMRIRSGTTGTPVNQAADRTLNLMTARPDTT